MLCGPLPCTADDDSLTVIVCICSPSRGPLPCAVNVVGCLLLVLEELPRIRREKGCMGIHGTVIVVDLLVCGRPSTSIRTLPPEGSLFYFCGITTFATFHFVIQKPPKNSYIFLTVNTSRDLIIFYELG